MKKALITGITGQDGSYLADLLIEKGYEVHERFYEIGTPAALAETETFLGRRLALEDEGRASIADTGPERPTPSADAA